MKRNVAMRSRMYGFLGATSLPVDMDLKRLIEKLIGIKNAGIA